MRTRRRLDRAARAFVVASGLGMVGALAGAAPAHAERKAAPAKAERKAAPARAERKAPPATAERTVPTARSQSLARLRYCESGGNYRANTGNGYYGAYQFSLATWRSLGYGGMPQHATPGVQDEAASRLAARSGWGQWPSCSRRIGLR